MPGTVLVRHYAGHTLQVQVLQQGFEYNGQTFKSLTAVANGLPASIGTGIISSASTNKEATRERKNKA